MKTFEQWLLDIPTPDDVIHDYYNDDEQKAIDDYDNYIKEARSK